MNQLALFTQAPSQSPTINDGPAIRARAAMGAAFENFSWWCRHGNRGMCAAVLRNRHGMSQKDASMAVEQISKGAAA